MVNWQETIQEHGACVWQIAYRLLGNHADASDCFQEVFLKAVKTSRSQKIRKMRRFLCTITTRQAIDSLRRKKRILRVNTTAIDMNQIESLVPSPPDSAQSSELAQQLRTALAKIPPLEATAFCLQSFNELSYRQIAEEINVKENYVGVLINRARQKLKDILNSTVNNDREVAHE